MDVRFEAFRLNCRTGELCKYGHRMRVQEKPLRILELLVATPGAVITRDELRQKLWPADVFVEYDHNINSAVNKLRFTLGDSAAEPRFIETVARGYRFVAPVEVVDAVEVCEPVEIPIRHPQANATPLAAVEPSGRRSSLVVGALAMLCVIAVVAWIGASRTGRGATIARLDARGSTLVVPPAASEAYRKGLYFLDRSPDELKKGLDYFRTAIALAPNFAAAYAGLGETYSSLGYAQYDGVPPEEAYAHAREAVLKALELDSTLAEAHVLLGKLQFKYEWNWTEADHTLRRAIQLNPESAPARDAYFDYLFVLGRNAEASREVQRAALLNPVSLTTNYNVAMSLIGTADYDRAIDRFRTALDLAPASAWALHMVGESYAEKRSWREALAALEQSAELGPRSPHVISVLAWAQGMAGNRDAAHVTLDRLIALGKTTYVSPHDVAVAQVGVGDHEGALTSLEQSYSRHDPWMSRLRVQTKLDVLRDHPRFQDLLSRLGLR